MTLHPAGHIRGAAQVRVETTHKGRDHVAVAAGDYKRAADPTAEAFEPVPCDTFITEATFALPVYRWEPPSVVRVQIADWIDQNRATGRVSLILCYALGKAQRLLAELLAEHEARGLPPPTVWTHGAVEPLIELYRKTGVDMLPTRRVKESDKARGKVNPFAGEIVMAPPSAAGSPWVRRLGPARLVDTAFVSGWMRIRGVRRRRGYDRGFVLSDHADWPDLIRTCRETGASRVLCTHGSSETLARHLREQGLDAAALETAYEPEPEE